MKKLILALLTSATVATATAQEPNSILLYGDASLSTVRDSTLNKTTMWDAHIGIGYQFNVNWTVGLSLMWGQNAFKDYTGHKTTENIYAVGPFVRYSKYFGKSEIFFWYGQFDLDYLGGYTTYEGQPAYSKNTGLFAGFYPAIGINLHHGLALNFNIGGMNYSSIKYKNVPDGTGNYTDPSNSTNSFNLTFGHQMNVGISKNFHCHHPMMHHSGEPGDEVHSRRGAKMDDEDNAAPKSKKKERNRDNDE